MYNDHKKTCFLFYLAKLWRREYSMIYREPGFLVVVWFSAQPIPSPLSPVSSADDTHEDGERETNCWREKVGKGVGEKRNLTPARKPGPLNIIQYSLLRQILLSVPQLNAPPPPPYICNQLKRSECQKTENVWSYMHVSKAFGVMSLS